MIYSRHGICFLFCFSQLVALRLYRYELIISIFVYFRVLYVVCVYSFSLISIKNKWRMIIFSLHVIDSQNIWRSPLEYFALSFVKVTLRKFGGEEKIFCVTPYFILTLYLFKITSTTLYGMIWWQGREILVIGHIEVILFNRKM